MKMQNFNKSTLLLVIIFSFSCNPTHEKNYNYIHPNFRGVNNTKDACCSELVISDIDASIDYALENANSA